MGGPTPATTRHPSSHKRKKIERTGKKVNSRDYDEEVYI
jgi:hypothetical protein